MTKAKKSIKEWLLHCPAMIVAIEGDKLRSLVSGRIYDILAKHFNDNRKIVPVKFSELDDDLPQIEAGDILVLEIDKLCLRDYPFTPAVAVLTDVSEDLAQDREVVIPLLYLFEYQHDGCTAVYSRTEDNVAAEEVESLIHHIVATTQADDLPCPDSAGFHIMDGKILHKDKEIKSVADLSPNEQQVALLSTAATWDLVGYIILC